MRQRLSQIAIIGFILLLVVSTAASYYRFVVLHDYVSTVDADCDPESEACFVWMCDAEIEECTGDPEEDVWYYKIVKLHSTDILTCENDDENCELLECMEENGDCQNISCTQETVEIYGYEDYCTNPATFSWE